MKNQKGFTAVEGLLIVLVLAVVGFGGFYVLNNNKDSKLEANTEEVLSSSTSNFMEIPEWGVRMKKDDLTKDAVYRVTDENNLLLSTETYSKFGGCNIMGSPVTGYLERGKAGNKVGLTQELIEDIETTNKKVKVGEYYYFWVNPQAPCANPDIKDEAMAMDKYQPALRDLAAKVESIPEN